MNSSFTCQQENLIKVANPQHSKILKYEITPFFFNILRNDFSENQYSQPVAQV